MKPLYAVLKVYFKDQPAEHRVTFTTEIYGVRLITVVYAWSQEEVSYLLSTCGSTELSEKMYMSYFEDDFSNVGSKEVIQPKLAD